MKKFKKFANFLKARFCKMKFLQKINENSQEIINTKNQKSK